MNLQIVCFETEKLWGHDLFHHFLNKWLEESLLCRQFIPLLLPFEYQSSRTPMRGKVGGLEEVDFTAIRPACSASQEDTLAYAVMTGSLQTLLSQSVAEN